ncbi:MAG: NADH-quinone oxidoreductase subunit J [Gemmatimonadota bacterium]|nr:NADH-quinone oxidoreductase subunit J [Gemmatimonadota bacterium]
MTFFFYLFAGVAIGGGIGVVMSKNPVASLLFMVTTLAAMAGTFVLLEAHFLAAIQIIVYAGAIMVLFLFVIMLLNLGHDYRKDLKGGAFAVLSFGVIGSIAGLLATRLRTADAMPAEGAIAIDAALAEHGAVGAIAEPLYTTYVVPFEITGILLLVAIVGAVVLAKREV